MTADFFLIAKPGAKRIHDVASLFACQEASSALARLSASKTYDQGQVAEINGIGVSTEEGAASSHLLSDFRHEPFDYITHLHREHDLLLL
jgi:hypothetical protein